MHRSTYMHIHMNGSIKQPCVVSHCVRLLGQAQSGRLLLALEGSCGYHHRKTDLGSRFCSKMYVHD